MARTHEAMTPEQAAAAIAEVGEYRQGLTARAAGMIWMVWGLALGGFSLVDVTMWTTGNEQGAVGDPLAFAFFLVVLVTVVTITWAIWRAQALATGNFGRFWATAGLAAVLMVAIAFVVSPLLAWAVDQLVGAPDTHFRGGMGVGSATLAATIMVLQRHHVSWKPGVIAILLGLALQAFFPFLVGDSESLATFGRASFVAGSTATFAFLAVGLVHFRRG